MSRDVPESRDLGLHYFTGLSRASYSPFAAAIVLWLCDGDANALLSRDEVLTAGRQLPRGHVDPTFLERFLQRSPARPDRITEPPRMQKHLIEDAVIETEATLRRFALHAKGIPTGTVTDVFLQDPQYEKAHDAFQRMTEEIGTLNTILLAVCPRCKLVGGIEAWFGYRKIKSNVIPQSWCAVCRATGTANYPSGDAFSAFDQESWFALSRWGKETGELTGWERRFAYSIGQVIGHNRPLTDRQMQFARTLAAKALGLGFKA